MIVCSVNSIISKTLRLVHPLVNQCDERHDRDKFAGKEPAQNSLDVGGTVFMRGIISARLGGLLMRDRDNIDSELRLVTALRRRTRKHHRPRQMDSSLNELIDELLEERQRSVTYLETRDDSTDLGPLFW
jgi:hypothetical protein